MVPDYRVHVIEVRKLQDTSIFRTDVKQVFDCIRFSENKQKLKELVENDAAYQKLDEEAYDMVAAYAVGGKELFKRKEKNKEGEKINMGQGFRDWIADERAEAKAEGVAEAVIDLLSGHGNVGEQLKKDIMAEKDLEILRTWLKTAAVVDSVEEFETRKVIRN